MRIPIRCENFYTTTIYIYKIEDGDYYYELSYLGGFLNGESSENFNSEESAYESAIKYICDGDSTLERDYKIRIILDDLNFDDK